jgi:hypothetical protein
MATRSASFTQKYWFARGYHDRLSTFEKDAPNIEFAEYVEEVTGVSIIKEYDAGYNQAEKDKVNNAL